MDNNKSSMETKLRKILTKIYRGQKENNDEAVEQILLLFNVVGRSEQFNCLGGNYAKGITECKEWCGEDMCQKPSN